ncbi:MAG: SDR family oxidoreductase [Phycisphaerales bacterium]|nr:SDR family oxidoreductase [Phycisphaerales bacterium]
MNRHEHGCVAITGAGSGIGAETARVLAGTGRPVLLAGRRLDALEAVAATIETAGGRSLAIACDVRDEEAVRSAIGAGIDHFGGVDGLVNAAGVMPIGPLPEADPADWRRIMEVNVLGSLHAIAAVLPGMLERGTGHILNIGSVAGHTIFPDATVYCASKSALHVISEGLRAELAHRRRDDGNRIRVSLIAPGAVDTPLPDTIAHAPSREATRAWYKRMEGILQPADVAETVRWTMDAPEHVSINEITVRPTEMVR